MKIGTDIVEVSRIGRAINNSNDDFLHRVFTPSEVKKINPGDPGIQRAAGLWAAKEAAVKALGYGYCDGITFHDIEITYDSYGCPSFIFTGRMKFLLSHMALLNSSLSISHCSTHATAVALLY